MRTDEQVGYRHEATYAGRAAGDFDKNLKLPASSQILRKGRPGSKNIQS